MYRAFFPTLSTSLYAVCCAESSATIRNVAPSRALYSSNSLPNLSHPIRLTRRFRLPILLSLILKARTYSDSSSFKLHPICISSLPPFCSIPSYGLSASPRHASCNLERNPNRIRLITHVALEATPVVSTSIFARYRPSTYAGLTTAKSMLLRPHLKHAAFVFLIRIPRETTTRTSRFSAAAHLALSTVPALRRLL
ncbi:hypothetical protein R3P38DRAFT_3281565 [Favolaschia claudopus]|uniref:Secreted protein n=1 Tax=Favolaschia claudopus TaxID=2862362 RepID=A0AAW0AFX2_9AGAR